MGKEKEATKVTKKWKDRLTQKFGEDGIHICGRIGGFFGIAGLALYLAAALSFEWAATDNLGDDTHGADVGASQLDGASFGLRGYCLKTDITGIASPGGDKYDACFTWNEYVEFANTPGWDNYTYGNFSGMKGCERFSKGSFKDGEPCQRRDYTCALLAFAMLFCFIGDVYSEKTTLNGLMMLLSALFAVGAVFTWNAFTTNLGAATSLDIGLGLILLATGAGVNFIGSIFCLFDHWVCFSAKERKDLPGMCNCSDDGVGFSGRLAACIAVITWMLLLTALATPNLSFTNNLGYPGKFCTNAEITGQESGCIGKATFGLWQYCIEAPLKFYANKTVPICLTWDEKIGTPGGVECDNPDPDWVQCGTPRHNVTFEYANGKKRFSSWSIEEKRQLTGWSLIGAILLIMLADIYSEKLWICCIMNFIACGASIFALIMWISFTDDLGLDTDDRLVLGYSGWILVAGFALGFATCLFYGHDWCCNMEVEYELEKPKEKKKETKTQQIIVKVDREVPADGDDDDD